jgi:hypothetical protein
MAFVVTLLAVTVAFAVSINWGAAAHPIYDQSGSAILADGSVVQLIWDQAGNGIDPPGCDGQPTGGDQLVDASAIGFGTFPNRGKFSKNINTNLVGPTAVVYVRAWNAASPADATHFGNSTLSTIDSAVAFTLDATASGAFATTEPVAVCVTWQATANPIYDDSGVGGARLADGDVVQLILDRSRDEVDPPDSFGLPTGDDQLLASSSIGSGVPSNTGTFIDAFNIPTLVAGDHIYVRAWNDASLTNASHYGDSNVFTINSDAFWSFDATAPASFATTNTKPLLAVSLSNFEATLMNQGISITWETAHELNNQGFNLYRNIQPSTPNEPLAFVPAQAPGSSQGYAYDWIDSDIVSGQTYYYWLEDIDLNGTTTLHGPVSATVVAPTAVTISGLHSSSQSAGGWLAKLIIAVKTYMTTTLSR